MSDPLEPIVRHQRLGHGRHAQDILIDYRLPLHPWSSVALPLVRQQLDRIFVFRGRTVRGLLGLTT
jgi:hypothetical protein